FELTLRAHHEHRLLVYGDGPGTGLAVAYQWGGLLAPGILEVRHDMRGKGIGRQLVGHRVAQARRKDEGLLYIQCKPASSIPFWQAMGFTVLPASKDQRNYAYRVLDKKLDLPHGGRAVDVTIRAYPEEIKWNHTAKPLTAASPAAMAYRDGTICLADRAYIFSRMYPEARDVIVEIRVNDRVLYRDKARYDEAEDSACDVAQMGFMLIVLL